MNKITGNIRIMYSRFRQDVSLPHLCHQFSVLGVDSCDRSDVLTVLQSLEELAVPQHEHVLIGHEHLEGVHSFLSHQFLHLSSHLQEGEESMWWRAICHHEEVQKLVVILPLYCVLISAFTYLGF